MNALFGYVLKVMYYAILGPRDIFRFELRKRLKGFCMVILGLESRLCFNMIALSMHS